MADLVREVVIDATPETVWPFLVDPAKHVAWAGTEAELDPRPGGVYRVLMAGEFRAAGEFVEVVPGERVVFTFGWDEDGHPVPPGSTTVEISLHPDGDKTRVRLVHRGLPDDAVDNHGRGWAYYLDRLALRAAGGDPGKDHGPGAPDELDPIAAHARALAATDAIVAGVEPSQLTLPTPCGDFDVRALLGHVVGGNHRFAAVARGEPGASVALAADVDDDGWLDAYRASAAVLSDAWRDPAMLDTIVDLPFGRMPGAQALAAHVVELVTHGWDLATATGQPSEIAPDLCAIAWRAAQNVTDEQRGPGRAFAAAVPVPADASATDRLVASLGRTP